LHCQQRQLHGARRRHAWWLVTGDRDEEAPSGGSRFVASGRVASTRRAGARAPVSTLRGAVIRPGMARRIGTDRTDAERRNIVAVLTRCGTEMRTQGPGQNHDGSISHARRRAKPGWLVGETSGDLPETGW